MNSVSDLTEALTKTNKYFIDNNYGFSMNSSTTCTYFAYDSALYLLDQGKIHLLNREPRWFGDAKTWYDEWKWEKGSAAKEGAIMCWSVSDGGNTAGHVAVCIKDYGDGTHCDYVESYSGHRFVKHTNYNYKRDNFRGFMYLPNYTPTPTPTPTPEPTPSEELAIGDDVIINGSLYVSSDATSPRGTATNRRTKITRIAKGRPHPYNTTGDLGWMDASSIKKV